MAKYKVYNHNKFPYGIELHNRVLRVPPHNGKVPGFVPLEEDEIYYLNSISRTFSGGFLITDDELMQNMGYMEKPIDAATSEDIEKILKQKDLKKIKSDLEQMSAKHAFDKVVEVAKSLDLPNSKIQVIEEVTGYDFKDVVKE